MAASPVGAQQGVDTFEDGETVLPEGEVPAPHPLSEREGNGLGEGLIGNEGVDAPGTDALDPGLSDPVEAPTGAIGGGAGEVRTPEIGEALDDVTIPGGGDAGVGDSPAPGTDGGIGGGNEGGIGGGGGSLGD